MLYDFFDEKGINIKDPKSVTANIKDLIGIISFALKVMENPLLKEPIVIVTPLLKAISAALEQISPELLPNCIHKMKQTIRDLHAYPDIASNPLSLFSSLKIYFKIQPQAFTDFIFKSGEVSDANAYKLSEELSSTLAAEVRDAQQVPTCRVGGPFRAKVEGALNSRKRQ